MDGGCSSYTFNLGAMIEVLNAGREATADISQPQSGWLAAQTATRPERTLESPIFKGLHVSTVASGRIPANAKPDTGVSG
jgi:hypothetical protein